MKNGISAKQAAELVGISTKTLYAYEEDMRIIKVDTLNKLSQIYDISIDTLMKKSDYDFDVITCQQVVNIEFDWNILSQ